MFLSKCIFNSVVPHFVTNSVFSILYCDAILGVCPPEPLSDFLSIEPSSNFIMTFVSTKFPLFSATLTTSPSFEDICEELHSNLSFEKILLLPSIFISLILLKS